MRALLVALCVLAFGGAAHAAEPTGPVTGTVWTPADGNLPAAQVGAAYGAKVTAKPPNAPQTKSIVCECSPGRSLPAGLKAVDHGTSLEISGTPLKDAKPARYDFELDDVWVDSSGAEYYGRRTFTIQLGAGGGEVAKTPASTVAAGKYDLAVRVTPRSVTLLADEKERALAIRVTVENTALAERDSPPTELTIRTRSASDNQMQPFAGAIPFGVNRDEGTLARVTPADLVTKDARGRTVHGSLGHLSITCDQRLRTTTCEIPAAEGGCRRRARRVRRGGRRRRSRLRERAVQAARGSLRQQPVAAKRGRRAGTDPHLEGGVTEGRLRERIGRTA